MKTKNISKNNIDVLTINTGFMWLFLSYICGIIFFTSSKYVLSNTSSINFLYWWYGSGLVFHTLYGINKGSISLESISKKYYRLLAIYVLLEISGAYSFFLSIKLMDPAIVSFLNQSQIIFTILFGFILLNEKLNKGELAATVIIVIGLFVMTFNSASATNTGIFLMLYANITGSANLVIVRKIGCRVGTLTFARIRTISLFTVFLSYNLYKTGKVEILSFPLLSAIIFGSFFGPFLNAISIYKSLEYLPAGKLALFRSVQPLFVMIAAGILFKSFPGFRELIGGLIIIFGSVILVYYHINHVIGLKRPLRALR